MMTDGDVLARLAAEAAGGAFGGAGTDFVALRALVEEASELGAGRALARLGLTDAEAERDVRELRELLGAWRDAKKAARAAVIGWVLRGCLALLLIGMAVKTGLFAMVRG